MTRAEMGSAHHQPNAELSPTPPSVARESCQHAIVCAASARSAELPNVAAARRFAPASQNMTAIDTAERTIPTILESGLAPVTRAFTASNATYAANRKRDTPTIRRAECSSCSMRSDESVRLSAERRQINTNPDAHSTKLSIPNASSAMLPARAPAPTATKPSIMFQATVMYSSERPRRRASARGSQCASESLTRAG